MRITLIKTKSMSIKKGANNSQGALYDPADVRIPDPDKDKTNVSKNLESDTIKDKTGMVKSLGSDTIKDKTGIVKILYSDTIKDKTGMVKSLDSNKANKQKPDENKAQVINGGTNSQIFYSIAITKDFMDNVLIYLYKSKKLDKDDMTYMEAITDSSMSSMKRVIQSGKSSEHMCNALKTKYISAMAGMLVGNGSLMQKISTIIDALKQAFLKTTGVVDKFFLKEFLQMVKLLLQMQPNESNRNQELLNYGGSGSGAAPAGNGGADAVSGTSDGTIDYLCSNAVSKLLKYIAKKNPDLCKIEILLGILKKTVSELNKLVPALDLSKRSK